MEGGAKEFVGVDISKELQVSKIRPRFLVWNMLRHDPRSFHAMMTTIRASNPLSFANTTQTDVFHSLRNKSFDS
ncbi:uncharacterized protein G2W53_026478 [Senna tora]|uniref:Uncharacterized protein n=1 Tax=Senna tora TaxID=362788 RepID=A0A834TF35_9FABA|nr:uncharacterized protein G2W53_026478 [Senna tora]